MITTTRLLCAAMCALGLIGSAYIAEQAQAATHQPLTFPHSFTPSYAAHVLHSGGWRSVHCSWSAQPGAPLRSRMVCQGRYRGYYGGVSDVLTRPSRCDLRQVLRAPGIGPFVHTKPYFC